jgi:hypothetical protein
MDGSLPEHLINEQQAVEAQIRQAFRSVRRAGGTSWSESRVVDNYGSDEEREAARVKDTERSWEDLVDDPAWNEEPGIGGFNFVDAIGYVYYIAPAMIRCARRGGGEFVGYALTIDGGFREDQIRLISPKQAAAIARFVRFMIAAHEALGDDIYGESWKVAYKQYWRQWDAGTEFS